MMLKVRLTALALLVLMFVVPGAGAQEARPVTPVAAQALAAPDAPVVVELFSSQACVFCPQADRLFADLVAQPGIIGLSCHVDYFDVREGALSKPFCTTRQNWYADRLHTGPAYTPQMILQGGFDVIGYKGDDVAEALKMGAQAAVARMTIDQGPEGGGYILTLPEGLKDSGNIFVFLYDKPREIAVAEGRNKGQKITYYNIVSDMNDLGPWPQGQDQIVVTPSLTAAHKGFAALLQNPETGRILAAGNFEFH